MDIPKALDQLADLEERARSLNLEKDKLFQQIMEPVKAEIDSLCAEYNPMIDSVMQDAASLESQIKTEVKSVGESVKGTWLQAVFVKGRVTWDTKGLEGFAVAFPDIYNFRKEGDPSVSIKAVK